MNDGVMVDLRMTIGGPSSGRAEGHSGRAVSRFRLLKLGAIALLGLSVIIAFVLAAFVIGLVLAVPLVVLGFFSLIRTAWQVRDRSGR